ncbi:hypothetical protein X801_05035, partial [Opisthorchis viverrini]
MLHKPFFPDGHIRHWLTGPGFDTVRLSFNGTRRHCTRMPGCTDYPGLCVYSVASAIKSGGLNTLCLDSSSSTWKHGSIDTQSSPRCSTPSMVLIGAYRVRIDVTSLIQASAGLTFGGPNKPTIYIPRSLSMVELTYLYCENARCDMDSRLTEGQEQRESGQSA